MTRVLFLCLLVTLSGAMFAKNSDQTIEVQDRPGPPDDKPSSGNGGCKENQKLVTHDGKIQESWGFYGCQKRSKYTNCSFTTCEDKK
ncbi:hypothetical protein [Acanthopleuribacter pedis]|uniref:Uncharacterized protein n=1 Tax=Acanthopleuribacter pedis TaxID=442870 RepID=A0A8J7QK22_9BACT|nr:hypothetical protein [Acanthopleuribacter pedis]MBO1322376.1 hypothetical protein [Acanthopleuribacter pedis]